MENVRIGPTRRSSGLIEPNLLNTPTARQRSSSPNLISGGRDASENRTGMAAAGRRTPRATVLPASLPREDRAPLSPLRGEPERRRLARPPVRRVPAAVPLGRAQRPVPAPP